MLAVAEVLALVWLPALEVLVVGFAEYVLCAKAVPRPADTRPTTRASAIVAFGLFIAKGVLERILMILIVSQRNKTRKSGKYHSK